MMKKVFLLGLGLAACALTPYSYANSCSPSQPCGYVTFTNATTNFYGIQVFDPAKSKVIAVSSIDGKIEGEDDISVQLYFPLDNKNKKLLFMACSDNQPNAKTGCSRGISDRCTYPTYKKLIISGVDPETNELIIQCVNH